MTPLVPTFAEAITYSELTSLRKVIFDRFGDDAPILLQRRTAGRRPYWRIDASAPADISREASGWDNGLRSYVLGYYGSTYEDCFAHVEVARALIGDGIPFRFYQAAWFAPVVRVVPPDPPDAPVLAPGAYSVAASFLSAADGSESLTSAPTAVVLDEPSQLEVLVPSWPWQWPLRGYARIYVGLEVGATVTRRLAATAPEVFGRHAARFLVSALPAPGAAVEPVQSAVPAVPLQVERITTNVYENPEKDGEYDGVLSIFVSRPIYPAPIQGPATYGPGSVTVSHIPDPDAGVGGIT